MLLRQEVRFKEVEEIKNKTQRVMMTLDLPSLQKEEPRSWLDNRVISVNVESIGIAFPLTMQDDVGFSETISTSTPAFLFSISSIVFATQRDETGNAQMLDFAFQFVPA
jgi:hypothetical protein